MKMNAIIVDDEEKSRVTLQKIISDFCKEMEIIAVASNIEEALQQINQYKPDVVFLDIEMPGGSGFELLNKLTDIDFEIIFITAYNQYAIRAFEYTSIDYLLKPINIEKLVRSVQKVYKRIEEKTSAKKFTYTFLSSRKRVSL